MKYTSHIPAAIAVAALFLLALVFIKSDLVIADLSNTAAVVNAVPSNPNSQYGKISPSTSFSSAATNGYIVELSEQPLTGKSRDLKGSAVTKNSLLSIKSSLVQQRTKVVNQQDAFLGSVQSSVKARNSAKLSNNSRGRKFNAALNAVVLDMTKDEADAVKKLPNVKRVELVQPVKAFLMDSVPLIRAPQVWAGNASTSPLTGKGITIAIIDTGIDYTHPDLGGCFGTQGTTTCKVAGGWDFVNNDSDPRDDMGHGTHVAAIAAGNGVLKGVAPDATLYAYKVLDSNGSGYTDAIVAGIERATDPNGDGDLSDRADIASLSLGGYGDPDDAMSTAVDNAVAAGVVVTVAAGNSGPSPSSIGSPGTARNAITVAASDKSDGLAYFSSRGPVQWTAPNGAKKYLVKPDVTAPGVDICAARYASAFPQGNTNCNSDNKHVAISGTSMATPHVAGEAALLLQLHRDWNPGEIKAAIRGGTVSPQTPCPPPYTCTATVSIFDWGYGRIDALKLVQSQKLPIAQLAPLGIVSGTISVTGTALASNFGTYKVSYGAGQNPTAFTDLYSSSQPVNNRVLFQGLDTTTLGQGFYTIRLMVTDAAGNTSTDKALMEIKNVSVTGPLTDDIYKPGRIVPVTGSILGSPSRFTVEQRPSGESNWSAAGITLSNGGIGGINNGTIASWNTSSMQGGRYYDIRVSGYYGNNVSSQIISNIYFDASLHTGWPVHIDFDSSQSSFALSSGAKYVIVPSSKSSGQIKVVSPSELRREEARAAVSQYYYAAGFIEPIADDLDKDGKKEVIIVKGGNPPKVQVFSDDGVLLWSKAFGSDAITGNQLLPLVGDINGDGYDEIVVHDIGLGSPTSNLYAFSRNGSQLWRSSVPKSYSPTMLMSDLDHDGKNEIVVQGNDANGDQMFIVDSKTGSLIRQWAMPDGNWGASIMPSPSIGNFDADDDLEIVSISPTERAGYDFATDTWTNEAALYVYNRDGSVVSGFPVLLPGSITSSPVVGDIDADGKEDIVVGLMYASNIFPEPTLGGLYAIDRTGHVMQGWPVLKGYNFWSTPSLSDINGDGRLEIVASRLGFSTYLLDYRGNIVSGWPAQTSWQDYYSSIMGDINNDNKMDILTTTGRNVYGWNKNGTTINGFPKNTESDAQAFASVSNLDGNVGGLNLLASSNYDYDSLSGASKLRGSIYVWDLQGASASSSLPWPTFQHDNQRTGRYLYTETGSTTLDIDPSVSVIDSAINMTYAPAGGENVLLTRFKFKIYAGSTEQKISKENAFWSYALSTNNGAVGGMPVIQAASGATDNGNGFYVIPAGKTALFDVITEFNPKQMFAGTYHGILDQVLLGDVANSTFMKIPEPNTTDPLVIIGEVSPYINSISPNPVTSDQQVTIKGVRFATSGNTLLLTGKTGILPPRTVLSTAGGTTIQFVPGVPEGDYYLQVTHPTTGTSNGISLTINPPAITATVNIITRVGGRVLTATEASGCTANRTLPNNTKSAGGCVYTLTNQPLGSYNVEWLNGYPSGADTSKKPVVTPPYPQTLGARPAGTNPVTFYIDYTAKPSPPALQNLTAVSTDKNIDLTWSNSSGLTGDMMPEQSQQDPTSGSWSSWKASNTDGCDKDGCTIYIGVLPNVSYKFRVRVYDQTAGTYSAYSNETTAVSLKSTTIPHVPTPIIEMSVPASAASVSSTDAPTASFTIEGQHSYTYTPGQTNHYKWSSTGTADTYSSSYTSTGPSQCGGGPWVANTRSGESSSYISSAYAGCIWTVTYTAKNSVTGQSASDTVVVSVVAATNNGASLWDAVKKYWEQHQ